MQKTLTSTGKPKILVVDDRPDGLLAVEAVRKNINYELVTAQSGPEALRHLQHSDFAVVLLDVQMPGMDGFDAAAHIKQTERGKETPILFMTAINKDDRHIYRGYESGAVDYIFKP